VHTAIASVQQEITVPWSIEAAFERFTRRIDEWWPKVTHSVGRADSQRIIFEDRVGGRVYEQIRDGRTAVWGTVLAWEPPRRFSMTWHAGRDDDADGQVLDVIFTSVGGGTRVELTHGGWERLGDEGPGQRTLYDEGWGHVLARYAEAASRP
jgi:uncharacterized protein YndB with AHSA1/START domain